MSYLLQSECLCSPKSTYWNLTTKGVELGGGTFGEGNQLLGQEGGALMRRISALTKETPDRSLIPPPNMWGHSKKGSVCPIEESFHQNLIMFIPWSQISTATTMRNKCMALVSYPDCRILLKQLDQIKTLPLYLLHGIFLRLGCVHIHLPDPTIGSKTVGIRSLFSSSTNKQ